LSQLGQTTPESRVTSQAQRLVGDQACDLVIVDLKQPEAAPLELLQKIRVKKPDLPVLIVTTASLVEEQVRGLDAGADDYIAKPFAFAEWAARIRAVLRRNTVPRTRC
jgi:two-component system, OmpR family, response regulator